MPSSTSSFRVCRLGTLQISSKRSAFSFAFVSMAFPMPINVHKPQADVFKRKFMHMDDVSIATAFGIGQKKAIKRRKRQDPSNEFLLNGDPV